MRLRLICYMFSIMLSGCYSNAQQQGVLTVHTYIFGTDTLSSLPVFKDSVRILFKNNRSIQQVPLIVFTSDSSGDKTSVVIKHYSYLDLDENLCYNYKTFSDTAKVIKHYSHIDSVEVDGGYNYFSNKKFEYDSAFNLADTVVNSVAYRRVRLNKMHNNQPIYFILYLNCERKNTLVKIFKALSDSLGCPIVRDDTFVKNKIFMTRELEFISDELSESELKVFEAWEKNQRRNR